MEQLRNNADATKAYTEQLEIKFKQAEQIEAEFAKTSKSIKEYEITKKKLEALNSMSFLLFF